ncbi:MAG TPA: DUF1579 family protein [Vicinamibacterales bacterium]|nr:DUF1579 family protein [Vicinamibacterales bacterium]
MTRVFAMLFAVVFTSVSAASQQKPTPEQIETMTEKTRPGAPHRELAALEGEWTQEIAYMTGTPNAIKGRGKATNRMILGGRFLVSERTSETAAGGALGNVKVDAMTIYGFDRRTNEYTIIELDTMGTYWVSAAGRPGEDKAIVMSGESLDDHGGPKEMRKFDMVLRLVDADTYVTKVVFKFPGRPPTTLVETVYRRVK